MKQLLSERTTWVGIFMALTVLLLVVAVFLRILTGTEFAAALGGVGAIGGSILAVLSGDRKKEV